MEIMSVALILLTLTLGYAAFFSVRQCIYILLGLGPHRIETIDPARVPKLSRQLIDFEGWLRDNGFIFIGAQRIRQYAESLPVTRYVYTSPDGETTVCVQKSFFVWATVFIPTQPSIMLSSRFADDSLLWTTYPYGTGIIDERLTARYVLNDVPTLFRHHRVSISRWTPGRGSPLKVNTLADYTETRHWIDRVHGKRIYERVFKARVSLSILYGLGTGISIDQVIRLWRGGGEIWQYPLVIIAGLLVLIETLLLGWAYRPDNAVDRMRRSNEMISSPTNERVHPFYRDTIPPSFTQSMRPYSGCTMVLLFPFIGVLLCCFMTTFLPGVLLETFNLTTIRQQVGQSWIQIPLPGDAAIDLEVVDEHLWALTDSTLAIWNPTSGSDPLRTGRIDGWWQTIYATFDNPQGMAVNGDFGDGAVTDSVWVLTHQHIVQCAVTTRACGTAYTVQGGVTIAAHGDQVLAVTRGGRAIEFANGQWTEYALLGTLPGFSVIDALADEATVVFTSDGATWIEWGYVWHRSPGATEWTQVQQEGLPVQFDILGTSPGYLWMRDGFGISRSELDLTNGIIFTQWNVAIGYENEFREVVAGRNGEVWGITYLDIMHFDGTEWETPNSSQNRRGVSRAAVGSDGQMWTQTDRFGALYFNTSD